MFKSPSSSSHSLYLTQQNWKCLHVRNWQYTEFHIPNFGSRQSFGKNLDIFSPLGFEIQRNSDHETPKIKLYSVRALKRCLNKKAMIHGRVTAKILKI